ncbi:hypothetical protein ACNKHK_02035 [Shigella flexneri]
MTAWRAAIKSLQRATSSTLAAELLWLNRQRWFTPQGFSRFPPARLEQFAVDVPDIGPLWSADQVFYQNLPGSFTRSRSREAEQDHVYYHHAAGPEPHVA